MSTCIENGFLLTRQVQDKRTGLEITLWLKTHEGVSKLLIRDELAVFFIEADKCEEAKNLLYKSNIKLSKSQSLPLKTFNQQSVTALYFRTLRDFYRARDLLKQNTIKCYEDDIRPDDRFLMERHITANIGYIGDNRLRQGYQLFEQVKCKKSSLNQNINLSMLSIDIECSMKGELYSIGLYAKKVASGIENDNINEENSDNIFKRVLMIGSYQNNTEHYIDWVDDEKALLEKFIFEVKSYDPDIIIGWNVIDFDFQLLQKRFDYHGIDFSIGRDNSIPFWRKNSNNTEQNFIEIAGRVVLDGIDLLKTATYSFPSFSLDNVAKTLLGLNKKVDDVENRIEEITHNFINNKPALAAYNLEDCRLVWLIFEKTQLLSFAQLRAQLTGLAIDRVGGSVAAFTNLYLPKLHRSGYVAPNMGDGESGLISPGGYVMDSKPGLYSNVLVLDFKSLYPSIIRTFKIDPMGLIEGLRSVEQSEAKSDADSPYTSTEVIRGFDGAYFSRTAHFLPDIIESLWLERDKAKQQKNAALSQAIKIIMNSFYGVLGSTGCRFFDPRLSGSITKRSHSILKKTSKWINELGYRVIYGDTDSIFVSIGESKSVEESQKIGLELQSFINDKWQQSIQVEFNLPSQLEIEFETHFTKFFMPTIRGHHLRTVNQAQDKKNIGTKKRYAGVANNKLVFKGLETVRSDWTKLSKTFQQRLYQLIFNEEPIEVYIKKIVDELKLGRHDADLIYSKKIRRQLNDYVNTPPHIKAALLANQHLKAQGSLEQYKRRSLIQYVMTLDGVQPLDFQSSKLDYDFYVEKQLKPIADDILPFIGKDFDAISGKQMGLF